MISTADVIASLRARDIVNIGHGPLYRRLQAAIKADSDDGIL
jgi:GntR family transcriptional regulator